jgi:hypothetical protein
VAQTGWREVSEVLVSGLVVGLVSASVVWGADRLLAGYSFGPEARLALEVVIGVCAACVTVLVMRRRLLTGPIGQFLETIRHRLPPRLQPYLHEIEVRR